MKSKSAALMAFMLVWTASAATASSRFRVRVLDERGQILYSTQAISLARGYAGMPVVVFERLGLSVKQNRKAGRVEIVVPESDSGIIFSLSSFQVRDFLHEEPFPTGLNSSPMVWRRGKFYVSAHIMKRSFDNKFSTRWNSRTHTITLQRSQHFANNLSKGLR